jgi:hypothetical protein
MTALVRKIHIYAGLLVFTQLIVYGIAGLVATFGGFERSKAPSSVGYVPFTVPPSSTDKEVAALVYRTLSLPMTRPIPDWFLRRTPDHHLLLDFYNLNGIRRVVVLEDQARLRIEDIHHNTWIFLEDVHAATPADEGAPRLVRIWSFWNEAGIWMLLLFCASGVWQWLALRPRFYWAWAALACGAVSFAALWAIFR